MAWRVVAGSFVGLGATAAGTYAAFDFLPTQVRDPIGAVAANAQARAERLSVESVTSAVKSAPSQFAGVLAGATSSSSSSPSQATALAKEVLKEPTHGHYDFAVVGGGILGVAIARQLLLEHPTKTVCVVEKEPTVAVHQSSHNSGCIHAGLYDDPATLKARLCVLGGKMLYDYCDANKLPARRCGKLVVATSEAQVPMLDKYMANATAAGQTGLKIVRGADAVASLEPNVVGVAALVSSNTGVVDFAAVTRRLAQEVAGTAPFTLLPSAKRKVDAKAAGKGRGRLLFRKEVKEVHDLGPCCRIVAREPGQPGPDSTINARVVITAAGLQMDSVAATAGGHPSEPSVVPFRGRYYQLKPEKADVVSRHIYPVPPFKGDVGVHFSPCVDETRGPGLIVGPSFSLALDKEAYRPTQVSPWYALQLVSSKAFWAFAANLGYASVSAQVQRDWSKARFVEEARQLIPSLTADDFVEGFTGVMAHSLDARTGLPFNDFIFEVTAASRHPALAAMPDAAAGGSTVLRRPVPRVVNVRNAPSPAATSALAIAEHVASIVDSDLKVALS